MNQLIVIVTSAWLAGVTAFVGGILAHGEGDADTPEKRELIHGVVAFGGGVLIAAVAFALAPTAMINLGPLLLGLTFCAGGLVFALIDVYLSRRQGTMAQFMAMLMDFVPEAISLGAVFAHDHRLGLLLAGFIGTQNLPEGFNAYREITDAGMRSRPALGILFSVNLLGPGAAAAGYFLLQEQAAITAAIMSFAGGGILYLIFQDIAPKARMERHWMPTLGAVLGFCVGMLGKQLIG